MFAHLESSGMVFPLKFLWQSFSGTFMFSLYLMASKMHFWLTWLDSLYWGQFEAGKQFWGMILSIGFRTMPTHEIWCPQPQYWAERGLQKFSVFCCRTLYYKQLVFADTYTVLSDWNWTPGWPGSRFLLPFLSPLS